MENVEKKQKRKFSSFYVIVDDQRSMFFLFRFNILIEITQTLNLGVLSDVSSEFLKSFALIFFIESLMRYSESVKMT